MEEQNDDSSHIVKTNEGHTTKSIRIKPLECSQCLSDAGPKTRQSFCMT